MGAMHATVAIGVRVLDSKHLYLLRHLLSSVDVISTSNFAKEKKS